MRDKSLLIMAFGQSNADVHNAGPRLAAAPLEDPRLVIPDDGAGFRGHMGLAPKRPVSGFTPFAPFERRVMSLTGAAGARVLHEMGEAAPARIILRSGAKGGRRLLGLRQGEREVDGLLRTCAGDVSPLFASLLRVIAEICEAAAGQGPEVGAIAFVFAHGESERRMERGTYVGLLHEMMDQVAEVLAPLALPLHWHLVQAAGPGAEGAGNAWPNRLALADIARARPDASLAAAAYPWPLADGVHYSAEGKALLGEVLGRAIAGQLSGTPRALPELARAEAEGTRLRLAFTGPELTLDPDPPAGRHGFAMARGEVAEVAASGHEVEITLAAPAGPGGLSYAYAPWSRGTRSGHPHAALGGGALRSVAAVPSILIPGRRLHDWAPAFAL
ncbi:hypothetical protein [Pseudoroseicyclus sp. CXY001]|uniref:hypothetical protein n=1 Tax=Pseudoroseicyclus sp. CXY001 TaxID=3242492 RepID=UPI00358DACAB